MGNVSTVGQAKTTSPWGAYDMGGNVVEAHRLARTAAAGIQLHPRLALLPRGRRQRSRVPGRDLGFGYFPGDPQIGRIYPWMGFRVGIIGNLN